MLRHKQGHASMLSREQFVIMSLKQDLLLFGHLDVVIYNMQLTLLLTSLKSPIMRLHIILKVLSNEIKIYILPYPFNMIKAFKAI
jgi:hypothetical protein